MINFLIINLVIVIRRQTPPVRETSEVINNKIYDNEEGVMFRTGIVPDRDQYVLVDHEKHFKIFKWLYSNIHLYVKLYCSCLHWRTMLSFTISCGMISGYFPTVRYFPLRKLCPLVWWDISNTEFLIQ